MQQRFAPPNSTQKYTNVPKLVTLQEYIELPWKSSLREASDVKDKTHGITEKRSYQLTNELSDNGAIFDNKPVKGRSAAWVISTSAGKDSS